MKNPRQIMTGRSSCTVEIVMSAARIMETQATVPVVGLNWNARTVPTAWELVPRSTPRAISLSIFR